MAVPVLGQHSAVAKSLDPHGSMRRSIEGKRVARSTNWVEGWWDNLGPRPIYIKDKEHLKHVCSKIEHETGRKLIPKAFMKQKSQGKGVEWSF